ncbi:hypothetical protein DRO02_03755 [archaeon]|nr:MAG: hypothetical protein DRO02_03755 [archaeon]
MLETTVWSSRLTGIVNVVGREGIGKIYLSDGCPVTASYTSAGRAHHGMPALKSILGLKEEKLAFRVESSVDHVLDHVRKIIGKVLKSKRPGIRATWIKNVDSFAADLSDRFENFIIRGVSGNIQSIALFKERKLYTVIVLYPDSIRVSGLILDGISHEHGLVDYEATDSSKVELFVEYKSEGIREYVLESMYRSGPRGS